MPSNANKTVHFKLTRKIGDDTIELNMSQFAEPGNERIVFNEVMSHVVGALYDYMSNHAPNVQPMRKDSDESGNVWIEVSRLDVELKSGKRYVKAKGGRYTEHGLTIWKEKAEKIGLDLTSIPDAGYVPKKKLEMLVGKDPQTGYAAIIQMRVGE